MHNQYAARTIFGDEAIRLARSRREREKENERPISGDEAIHLARSRQEQEKEKEKETARNGAAAKLEFALTSMGFRAGVARSETRRFMQTHPNDDFRELGTALGAILRSVPS